MNNCFRFSACIPIFLTIMVWTSSASANLVLSFNQTSYSTRIGGSVSVGVYITQVAGGSQVAVGNELVTGSIQLSFATTGPATVLNTNQVTYGPLWDLGTSSVLSSGSNTLYNTSLLSVNGIANLTSPVLLATYLFTATSVGTQTIRVSEQDPNSPDFITANGNVIDPTNIPSATITVSPAVVPEPGSMILVVLGGLAVGSWARLRPIRQA